MNSKVISQINQLTDCIDDFPFSDIPSLIQQLSNPDGLIRMQAREILSCIGKPAVTELIKSLSTADPEQRWQIIKVLENIQDPTAVSILVDQLRNDNAGVRWAASTALIGLKRAALPALLEALMHNFDSLSLRQSAHHILHVFKDDGRLTDDEEKVYEALDGIEPTSSVPWAASKALEALRNNKNNLLQY